MHCNKLISLRVLASMVLSVFFLLALVTPYASADTKIGLDGTAAHQDLDRSRHRHGVCVGAGWVLSDGVWKLGRELRFR